MYRGDMDLGNPLWFREGLGAFHRKVLDFFSNRTYVFALTISIAAALRFFRIGHESIWLDEAFTIDTITRDYTSLGLLFELPPQDFHPPLYFFLLDIWVSIFGTSEVAIRLPSAVFGIVSVAVIYALGKKVFDFRAGITAALLLTVSPFHIYYAQEARTYTLLALLTAISYYFLVDIVNPDRNLTLRTLVGYVIVTALLGYTHVFGFLVIAAQNIYVLPRLISARRGGVDLGIVRVRPVDVSLPKWIGIQTMVAALLGPWIFVVLGKIFTISGGGSNPIAWIGKPRLLSIPYTILSFLFGELEPFSFEFWITAVAGFVILAVAGVAVVVHRADGQFRFGPAPGVVMFLTLIFTPVVGGYLISVIVTPVYVNRYMISASIGLYLLVGAGVSVLWTTDPLAHLQNGFNRLKPRHGYYVVAALVVLALIFPLIGYYANDQKEQWREAVDHVESSASSDALVILTDNYTISPYRYYADRSDLDVRPIDDDSIPSDLTNRVDGYSEVWIVHSHAEQGAVSDSFTSSPEFRIAESHEHRYNNIRIYSFERVSSTTSQSSDS